MRQVRDAKKLTKAAAADMFATPDAARRHVDLQAFHRFGTTNEALQAAVAVADGAVDQQLNEASIRHALCSACRWCWWC
jgi:hypothetical protein